MLMLGLIIKAKNYTEGNYRDGETVDQAKNQSTDEQRSPDFQQMRIHFHM